MICRRINSPSRGRKADRVHSSGTPAPRTVAVSLAHPNIHPL